MMGSSDLQNWTVSWGRISASLSEYYLLCFCYYQIARKMSREPILLQQFGARYFLQGYEVDTQNFCQLIASPKRKFIFSEGEILPQLRLAARRSDLPVIPRGV